MASRQKAGDTWPAAGCQLLPDDSGTLSEPKWSGPGTATVAHPALSRVAGSEQSCRAGHSSPSVSPTNPPTTVPNGGQHAKSCHRLYSATASLRSNHSLAAGKSTRQSRIKADNELHTLVIISSRVDGGWRELRPGYACSSSSRVMPRVLCGMPAPRVGGRDSSAAVTPVPVSQPVGAHPSARPHVHSSCEQPVLWCESSQFSVSVQSDHAASGGFWQNCNLSNLWWTVVATV